MRADPLSALLRSWEADLYKLHYLGAPTFRVPVGFSHSEALI